MSIKSRDKSTTIRITRCGILSTVALLFSYLESLIPISLVIPLPGFRLGISNIIITIVLFEFSFAEAGIISIVKIFISALLFGNPISFIFSLMGSSLSLGGMATVKRVAPSKFSFIGISILGAALHNCGQILAAMLIFRWQVIGYLPLLLIASIVFGGICGVMICAVFSKINKHMRGGRYNA